MQNTPMAEPIAPPRPPRSGRLPLTSLAALAALAALTGVAGCGGSPSSSASGRPTGVASIPSAAGSASSSSTSAPANTASGRPQERVDDSPATDARLSNRWMSCLQQHGATVYALSGKTAGGITLLSIRGTPPHAAVVACASKQPLPPAAEDPNKNPHYQDDIRTWVNCINAKGYEKVQATSTGPTAGGWTYVTPATPANAAKAAAAERACEIKAFG